MRNDPLAMNASKVSRHDARLATIARVDRELGLNRQDRLDSGGQASLAADEVTGRPNEVPGTAKQRSLNAMADEIVELAAQRAVIEGRLIEAIASFTDAGGADQWRSVGQWVGWHLGLTTGEAHRLARVTEKVAKLPALAEAIAEGKVSLSAADAIAKVATPKTDEAMVELTESATGPQIEKICRDFAKAQQQAGKAEPFEASYAKRKAPDHTSYSIKLPTALAAKVDTAVQAMLDQLWDEHHHTSEQSGIDMPKATRVDAFMRLVEFGLTDAQSSGSGADRYQIQINLDVDHGAEIAGQHLADRAAVEQLLCDVGLSAFIKINGIPVWATEQRRTPSRRIRRALEARDRHCQYPGCATAGYLEAHHLVHHAHGGETSWHNLVLICPFHHGYLHQTDRTLQRDSSTGKLTVRTAHGSCEDGHRRWRPPDEPLPPPDGVAYPKNGRDTLTQYARDVWVENLDASAPPPRVKQPDGTLSP